MSYQLNDQKVIAAAIAYGGILTKAAVVYRLQVPLEDAEHALKRLVKHHVAIEKKVRGIEVYDIPSAREQLSDLDGIILQQALNQGGYIREIDIKGYNLEAVEEALKHLEVHGILLYDTALDRYQLRGIIDSATSVTPTGLAEIIARLSGLENAVQEIQKTLQARNTSLGPSIFLGVQNVELTSDEDLDTINRKLDDFTRSLQTKGLPSALIRNLKNDFIEFWKQEGGSPLSEKTSYMIKVERNTVSEPVQVTFLGAVRRWGKTMVLAKRSYAQWAVQ